MARVVLVETWFRGSHAAWARSVADRSRHDVVLCTLPGVHWKWRMQGGPVSVAGALPSAIDELGGVDLLLASGAVDLSALLGLARPHLDGVPAVLYLHENQLTYPLAPGELRDLTYAMVTWRSMLAADHVVLNSRYHRDELLGALPGFLRNFPDHRRLDLLEDLRERTSVIGVGIDVERFRPPPDGPQQRSAGAAPRILWNHRWEHDKDPARFVAAMTRLAATERRFELVVAGSHLPDERVLADLGPLRERTVHVGTATEAGYPQLLRGCDLVVSTARHEFYGVAVAEAMAAGAVPVLPRGLAYDELVPAPLQDEVLYRDDAELDLLLARGLDDAARRRSLSEYLQAAAEGWSVTTTVDELDQLVDRFTASSTTGSGAGGSG